MKTNRDLFEAFEVIESTWKRWSREFLPPDPSAGKSKGKAREYNQDEAFMIWFGGQLLVAKQMSVVEAKDVVKALGIYMDNQGFIPIETALDAMRESNDHSWGLVVIRHITGVVVQIKVIHKISPPDVTKDGEKLKIKYTETHSTEQILSTRSEDDTDNFCVAHIGLEDWITRFLFKAGY